MSEEISLSVEESNRLRESLGLKPLRESGKPDTSTSSTTQDDSDNHALAGTASMANDVLVAPVVPGEKSKQDEIRAKLQTQKEKREIAKKLAAVKTLGEADEEDDISSWVKRSREIEKAKEEARRKEKEMQELEEQLVAQGKSSKKPKPADYTEDDIKDLKVLHDVTEMEEGTEVIMTFQDTDVLGDANDVLENVNLVEAERTKKKLENAKKKDYMGVNALDDYGDVKKVNLLAKYDGVDSLTGDIKDEKRQAIAIGELKAKASRPAEDHADEEDRSAEYEAVRERLKRSAESLESVVAPIKNADYYTADEVSTKFKKKRKVQKKSSKVLKADDLLAEDDLNVNFSKKLNKKKRSDVKLEDGVEEAEGEEDDGPLAMQEVLDEDAILAQAGGGDEEEEEEDLLTKELNATRSKLRYAKTKTIKVEEESVSLPSALSAPSQNIQISKREGGLVFSSMTEFVRHVGGEEDEDEERKKRARKIKEEPVYNDGELYSLENAQAMDETEDRVKKADSDVESTNGKDEDEEEDVRAILGEEKAPKGIGGVLLMASRKGYFDEEKEKRAAGAASSSSSSGVKHSSTVIVDQGQKRDDRDRERRTERDSRSEPFTIPGYKPSFKLEYKDEKGRILSEKDAFRQMSHVFHGKGSGKLKTEKRLKKIEEEEQLKKMSASDAPLGFLKNIERQQTAIGSAHIVLTGSQQTLLSKPSKK